MNMGNDTDKIPIDREPGFPNLDALPDDELKEFADEFREALNQADLAIRGWELATGERRRKARWKRRKDRRIIECWRNANEIGRGKFIFIITQSTFEQIIQYIEEVGGYSSEEVVGYEPNDRLIKTTTYEANVTISCPYG